LIIVLHCRASDRIELSQRAARRISSSTLERRPETGRVDVRSEWQTWMRKTMNRRKTGFLSVTNV
jgi:hypothetical protein